jgi:hypothetical protein
MKLNELSSGPIGELRIYKTYLDGAREKVFEGKNLIVTTGKSILLNQLYYTSLSGDPLSHAKIGTGGAIDVDGIFLKVPTTDLTDLYTPIASTSIIKTDEDISVPSITLLANVDNSVGNGSYINEAGFFSVSGAMFNIKVFPRILKKSSFSLNLEWVIRML